jgi:o-succinylbenzoate synthase
MIAIRELRADRLRIPFRRPFPTASGMWLERETWIIRLIDADGRVGLGEAVLDADADDVADTILAALIRDAVTAPMTDGLPSRGALELHGAPGRALNAALESAQIDLERDGPLSVLMPDGDGVGVNATLPSLGPDAVAEAARQAVESGFATLKVKAGAERETEVLVERIGAIRRAVGPDVRLRLDVNGAWDLPTAEDRLEAIARFGIEYVEQPLPPLDVEGLAALRRRIRVPIAADEAVTSVAAARELVEADAVDALVVKPVRVGGPSAAGEIADLAARRGVPVIVSTLFETGIGIASALSIAAGVPVVDGRDDDAPDHGLATAGLLEHDLLAVSLLVEDGRMFAPLGAGSGGLGVALDERALERFRVDAVGVAG